MHNNQRLQNEVREISIGGGAWPYRGGALQGSGPYAILEAVPTQQAEEVERCLVEPLAG